MDTLTVSKWDERDRLHIALNWGDDTIAEWWDDDARQMFEDGFFDGRRLDASVVEYAQSVGLTRHYIAGSGTHGCLYDHCECYGARKDAVEDLAQLFELGRTRKASLKRTGYLELRSGRDGAEYCEIIACDCCNPEQHSDGQS